jgi:endoglucanase
VIAVGAIAGGDSSPRVHAVLAQPPAVGTTVIARQQSKARIALENLQMDADATAGTTYLAAQPTAYWLTPEQTPSALARRNGPRPHRPGRDQNCATGDGRLRPA